MKPRTSITHSPTRRHAGSSRGQAMIFLMMALVILFFVVIWNFDLHGIIHIKNVSQNAGDAAALMAARWQGITLNVIGDLNIMQALALSADDPDACETINDVQARLCYTGPMIAFMASQQAAKQNGIYRNPDFDELLREHADEVRFEYPAISQETGEMLFPEPYPGCWQDYADMLEYIANEGVAAGADNASFYSDGSGGHTLYDMDFYQAIAGFNWCWFHHRGDNLLEAYENFQPCWWPALPEPSHRYFMNSEIYGLGLSKLTTTMDRMTDFDQVDSLAQARFNEPVNATGMTTEATWYCYGGRWGTWDAMSTSGWDPFPAVGPVKAQYDYSGADAAVRVEAVMDRLTPGTGGDTVRNTVLWTAAAKPFGYLNDEDKPDRFSIVLPAFHEVGLIPVDASSAPSGGSFDIGWRRHMEHHLPIYVERGPEWIRSRCPDCGEWHNNCEYCWNLITWESPEFRQAGLDWLSTNSYLCDLPSGPGGGHRGGGSRRGH